MVSATKEQVKSRKSTVMGETADGFREKGIGSGDGTSD